MFFIEITTRYLIAIVICLIPHTLFAEDWSTEIYASSSASYIDNVLYSLQNEINTWRAEVVSGLRIYRSTETASVGLTGSVKHREHGDSALIDSTDPSLGIVITNVYERSKLSITMTYNLQTTSISEEKISGPVQTDREVARFNIAPNYEYALSERSRLSFNVGFIKTDYEAEPFEFSDYSYASSQLALHHTINHRTEINLAAGYSRLVVPDVGLIVLNDIESVTSTDSYSVGLAYAINEINSLEIELGSRKTERILRYPSYTGVPEKKSDGSGQLYSFNYTNKGQVYNASLSASLELSPSGDGLLNESRRVNGKIGYNLTEKSSISADVGRMESRSSTNKEGEIKHYTWIRASFNKKISKNLYYDLKVSSGKQRIENGSKSVYSHSISASVNYTWNTGI
jgi:hypothetical protein